MTIERIMIVIKNDEEMTIIITKIMIIGKEGDATFGFFEVSQGAYQKLLQIESRVTFDL